MPHKGRRSATGKSSPCGIVSYTWKTKFQCRVTFRLAGTKKFCSAAYVSICKQGVFSQRSITSHLVAVNQRLMSPSLGDLAEWLCKAFWRLITNHLATVFRVPGQKFFGWLPSGMASSLTSSSISWDEMWIFRGSLIIPVRIIRDSHGIRIIDALRGLSVALVTEAQRLHTLVALDHFLGDIMVLAGNITQLGDPQRSRAFRRGNSDLARPFVPGFIRCVVHRVIMNDLQGVIVELGIYTEMFAQRFGSQ